MDLPSKVDDRTLRLLSRYQLLYSLCGLGVGLGCVVGGLLLLLNGITGTTSWTARALGAESQISDAAPGVVLFVIGLFIVVVTRFSVRVQKSSRAIR
jgi:hypothetical protein